MVINTLYTFWRRLWSKPLTLSVGVFGSAIGIASAVILFALAADDLLIDKFQPDYQRIFRIYSEGKPPRLYASAGAPLPVASELRNKFIGIDNVSIVRSFPSVPSIQLNTTIVEHALNLRTVLVDDEYFSLFNHYQWIAGRPEDALSVPGSVVITRQRARAYFGQREPVDLLGEQVYYNDSLVATITGIVDDVTWNTDFDFTDFISLGTVETSSLKNTIQLDSWTNINSAAQIFVKTSAGNSLEQLQEQLNIIDNYTRNRAVYELSYRLVAQPLGDVHFDKRLGIFDHSDSAADRTVSWMLFAAAILIFAVSTLNTVTLLISYLNQRGQEFAVRRTVGATPRLLITEIVVEYSLFLFAADLIAISGTIAFSALYRDTLMSSHVIDFSSLQPFILIAILNLISMIYFVIIALSSVKQLIVVPLNGWVLGSAGQSRHKMRLSLSVLQLIIAQCLIIIVIQMQVQVRYMLKKDLGFMTEGILYTSMPEDAGIDRKQSFISSIENLPGVSAVSLSMAPIFGGISTSLEYNTPSGPVSTSVRHLSGDTTLMHLFKLKLLFGRNYRNTTEPIEVLINETYLKILNEKSEGIIGRTIGNKYVVVGIVQDFHMRSLHSPIQPCIVYYRNANSVSIQISNDAKQSANSSTISQIEETWSDLFQGKPVYGFLKNRVENFYAADIRQEKIMRAFGLVSVIVACLGLFALSSLLSISQFHEIAIRKILGDTTIGLLGRHLKYYLRVLLLGFVLSAPIAYSVIDWWLRRFTYRVEQTPGVYLYSFSFCAIVGLGTVIYHCIRASSKNPIDVIRSK